MDSGLRGKVRIVEVEESYSGEGYSLDSLTHRKGKRVVTQ